MILRNRQLIIAYKNVFNSPDGKIVLADLKKRCPMLTEAIATSSGIDVNKLLVLEGRSDVLKHVYKMMGRDPNEEATDRAVNNLGE